MFKLFGVALYRAYEYSVLHGVAILITLLFVFFFLLRRYNRIVQKDRASKALHRTNVFVVLGESSSINNTNDDHESSMMKNLEEQSDDDVDDIDYAKLLRELDTPENLRKQLDKDKYNTNDNDDDNDKNDDSDDDGGNQKNGSLYNNKKPNLPPASTTRAKPFALRLMDAVEHTAVTQLSELVRLHSSMHKQNNMDTKKFMDQTAVFDIPENTARNRAVSILEGALRQRRRDAEMMSGNNNNNNNNNNNTYNSSSSSTPQVSKDIEDEIYHSLFDNHCTSSIPSPASILNSNRHNPFLVGSAKANAPLLRHREAYYTSCIDSAMTVEDATFNFASHFAYGMDVMGSGGGTAGNNNTVSTGKILTDFFLGVDRFAKGNLRGGHVITAGGILATIPDPLVCRRDLLLAEKNSKKNNSSSSSNNNNNNNNNKDKEERAAALSAFHELSDDWTKGASWSRSSGDELSLLRRYDELVVLCIRSGGGTTTSTSVQQQQQNKTNNNNNNYNNTNSGGSDWSLPSCVSLFASLNNNNNGNNHNNKKQPRVITCTTPHAVKYLLPEYSSARDSTISSQRRYRYHLENVAAIRKALERHAEDIAIEGFAVGERVKFKRSPMNKVKEWVADAIFGFGKYFGGGGGGANHQKYNNGNSSLFSSSRKTTSSGNDEEMSRLIDNNNNEDNKKNA